MDAVESNSRTAQILSVAELSDDAAQVLRPDAAPQEFVDLLTQRALFPDAVRFLAHALPKRECVWWGWVCAKRASGETPPPKIKAALEATEKWIAQPTEDNRRAAKAATDVAGLSTAAGCAGLAAFFSGGSLAPPEAPVVPPGEFLTAKAVSGAVIIAAIADDPKAAPEKFKSFIAQGLDVTKRIKLWETPPR
jgi:hypothetical protein